MVSAASALPVGVAAGSENIRYTFPPMEKASSTLYFPSSSSHFLLFCGICFARFFFLRGHIFWLFWGYVDVCLRMDHVKYFCGLSYRLPIRKAHSVFSDHELIPAFSPPHLVFVLSVLVGPESITITCSGGFIPMQYQ